MRARTLIALIALTALLPSMAQAAARQQLNAFVAKAQALSATFEQDLRDVNNKLVEQSRGNLALKTPRQFRWQVTKPAEQLIVADGDNVYSYDVELEQVTIRQQGLVEADSPLAILLDPASLDLEYQTKELPKQNGMEWLRLTAKTKQAEFKHCDLGLAGNELKIMRLTDNFGQVSQMKFSGWKRNPKLSAGTFAFKIPAGVDVIGAAKSGAAVQKLPD